MLLIFSFILLALSIIMYIRFKSYIAPSVIISFVWGGVFLGYFIIPHGMYDISDRTVMVFFCWTFFSVFGAYIFSLIKVRQLKNRDLFFNQTIRNVYYWISLIAFIPLMYIAYKQGTTMGQGSFLFNLRMANTGIVETEYKYGIFQYGFAFAMVSFLIEVYTAKKMNKRVIILFAINLFLAIITMAKTSFFFLFISFFALNALKYNYSIKKLIPVGAFILLFVVVVQLLRAGSSEDGVIGTMFNVYIFGGIPALNEIVNANTHTIQWGDLTFRFFYTVHDAILGGTDRVGFVNNIFEKGGYVFIPYPTNVYTVIYPYWMDFGFIGVILGGLLNGSFVGFIYNLATKKKAWAMALYAYLVAVLALPFFGEYLVTNLSYTIQLVVLFYIANKFNFKFTFNLKR